MVSRVTVFTAKAGKEKALETFLNSLIPVITAIPGCESCVIVPDEDSAGNFTVVEQWNSIEAHKASIKNIPPELLKQAMELLAQFPQGQYIE